jgi:hypothetical protein
VSWQAQAWAIEMGKRFELDPSRRWMLAILANYADPEGNDIFPSIKTLQADTGFSESSVRRHIKHLIQCGLVAYGKQEIVALKIARADLRPKCYRLVMDRATGGQADTPLEATGCQTDAERGVKRGVTVTPKPITLKEKPCRGCDRARTADALTGSGLCADCAGMGPNAAQEGAAYREQLRLRRLAGSVGKMPA